MEAESAQIIIPALILSHLIVAVACAFIGYHVSSRDSLAIIDDLMKEINKCASVTKRRTKSVKSSV